MAKNMPFDEYSSSYEDWFERNKFAFESELQAIKEVLPKSKNSIEIGVGSGRFAAPLAINIGIDPSKKMREIAQKRGIKTINAVAEYLPFKDCQFEFALMITTICFLDNVESSFKEVHRILKPYGYFIIGLVDKDSLIGKLYQQHKNENVFYKVANFYSVDEVFSHLKKVGFREFNINQTIFHKLTEISEVESTKEGYGDGSFVVIKATKRNVRQKKQRKSRLDLNAM